MRQLSKCVLLILAMQFACLEGAKAAPKLEEVEKLRKLVLNHLSDMIHMGQSLPSPDRDTGAYAVLSLQVVSARLEHMADLLLLEGVLDQRAKVAAHRILADRASQFAKEMELEVKKVNGFLLASKNQAFRDELRKVRDTLRQSQDALND